MTDYAKNEKRVCRKFEIENEVSLNQYTNILSIYASSATYISLQIFYITY